MVLTCQPRDSGSHKASTRVGHEGNVRGNRIEAPTEGESKPEPEEGPPGPGHKNLPRVGPSTGVSTCDWCLRRPRSRLVIFLGFGRKATYLSELHLSPESLQIIHGGQNSSFY